LTVKSGGGKDTGVKRGGIGNREAKRDYGKANEPLASKVRKKPKKIS